MDHEVIELDSDDDVSNNVDQGATASVSILNSRPLDLFSLGIGISAPLNGSSNGGYVPNGNGQVIQNRKENHQSLASYRKALTVRANSIKSKHDVAYTHQILPLRSAAQSQSNPISSNGNYQRRDSHTASVRNHHVSDSRSASDSPPIMLDAFKSFSTGELQNFGGNHVEMSLLVNAPRAPVSDARLHNYNFEAHDMVSQDDGDKDCTKLRFRCSYGTCRRLVVGNCAFMNHIWAHLNAPKDPKFIEKINTERRETQQPVTTRGDIEQMATCPQCLARFHTPYLMQTHYTRAHSRQLQAVNKTTCVICERDLGLVPNALRNHLSLHPLTDAPYNCRKCKYRCTVRMHLVDHFFKEHAGTSALMCPFCTFTVSVSASKRRRGLVSVPEFVEHMISHELDTRVSCELCSCSFSSVTEKLRHRRDHMPVNARWTIVSRNPETLTRLRSKLKLAETKRQLMCRQCKPLRGEAPNPEKKCLPCIEARFYKSRAGQRLLNVGTIEREGVDTLLCSVNKADMYVCQCGMKTNNGQKMTSHWIKTQHNFDIVPVPNTRVEKNKYSTQVAKDVDIMEAKLFAVLPKEDQKRNKGKEVDDLSDPKDLPMYYHMEKLSKFAAITPADLDDAVVFFKKTTAHFDSFEEFSTLEEGSSMSGDSVSRSRSPEYDDGERSRSHSQSIADYADNELASKESSVVDSRAASVDDVEMVEDSSDDHEMNQREHDVESDMDMELQIRSVEHEVPESEADDDDL